MSGPIRVLIVQGRRGADADLIATLQAEGDIKVVAAVPAAEAVNAIDAHRPDLVAVDLDPAPAALGAIEAIMTNRPVPVLALSSTVAANATAPVEALVAGALEAMPRPRLWDAPAGALLRSRVRALRGAIVAPRRGPERQAAEPTIPVVGIAASAGGPAALAEVLSGLAGLPAAVLIVQHIHADFLPGFVSWMGRVSALPVMVAADRVRIRPGTVYVGIPGLHLRLGASNRLDLGPEPLSLHRPSADAMFESIAQHAGSRSVGVILTGMGDDGAAGLKLLRRAGGATIVQDEATCAVFGMPRAAIMAGAAADVVPLDLVARTVVRAVAQVPA